MTSLQKLRPPTAKMDCDECKKVHAESASCWQAYLAEKHLNRCRRFNKPSDRNPQKQNELLRLYQLATAHERVHRARAHPDKKHVVRLGDLKLILCKLREHAYAIHRGSALHCSRCRSKSNPIWDGKRASRRLTHSPFLAAGINICPD
jgi:hypothetical protein